jgi:hypothetical protein
MMRALLPGALLLAAGCTVATAPCESTAPVQATWRYAAVEDTPAHATLSGTLAISRQDCAGFTGQLDVIEVSAGGVSRRIAGPVSGSVIDATSLRFDAWLEGSPRQHLATLAGDSLAGTWVLVDGGGSVASGSFGGHR